MSILHDFAELEEEEKLFIAGVLYLDNMRLRRLVSRVAMRVFNYADATPLTREDEIDIGRVVADYAQDLGVENELTRALRDVRWPARSRRRKRPAA